MYTLEERLLLRASISAYVGELKASLRKQTDDAEKLYLEERIGKLIGLWQNI